MRALKLHTPRCAHTSALVTIQAREGIETIVMKYRPSATWVTIQAREGIETRFLSLTANTILVTIQAREGIETIILVAAEVTESSNNSSP